MKKVSVMVMAMILCMAFGILSNANAIPIRVSQESSAGAGDFDDNVLGFINPFATGLTIADFYQYGSPDGASYNGQLNGGPSPVSSLSQVFLVDASDGLSLTVVHDNPDDGSGGRTRTQWNLAGDPSAAFVVVDDPGEGVVVSAGGTQFNSTKSWLSCCTDGYAIGSLDGDWEMYGKFLETPTGISEWAAVSSDGGDIFLALEPERRVRLDVASVSEPATLLLLGVSLVGFAGLGRKKIFKT